MQQVLDMRNVKEIYYNGQKVQRAYAGRRVLIFQSQTYNDCKNIYEISNVSSSYPYYTNVTVKLVQGSDLTVSQVTDWGDGTKDTSLSHTYTTQGPFIIRTNHFLTAGANTQYAQFTFLKSIQKLTITQEDNISCYGMFSGFNGLETVTNANVYTDSVRQMFYECSALKNINIKVSNATTAQSMFEYCTELVSANVTSESITSGYMMFYYCQKLTDVQISIPSLASISNMFNACRSLASINLDASNVTIGELAFKDCISLTDITLNAPLLQTGNYMFQYCESLVNPSITAPALTDGSYMFNACTKLTGVRNFNPSVIKKTPYMFKGCSKLANAIIIPRATIQTCMYTFMDCTSLTTLPAENIDLINNPKSGISTTGCYRNCTNLTNPLYSTLPSTWK